MGSGSGVIISNKGYIVTNNHVIDRADEIEVTLHNNETYKAKVIGTDPSTDIALLQIREDNLQGLSFGNSDHVRSGRMGHGHWKSFQPEFHGNSRNYQR